MTAVSLPLAAIAACMAALVVGMTVQIWYLRRLRSVLESLAPLDERLTRLTRSVTLLVDTTEGCFDAIAGQIVRNADTPPAGRQQRQRRVVSAARRGRSVAQIAADESVAEGEVALRLTMARDVQMS